MESIEANTDERILTMFFNKQVERFITVAEKGSISEAARALYLTQPALSREIHALEDKLGFHLFGRTKSGVVLTKMGQSYYEDMKKIYLLEENAIKKARALAYQEEKIIRMGVFIKIVELNSIQLGLQNFAKAFPDVTVQFIKTSFSFREKREMLLDNILDVFWREGVDFNYDDGALEFTELFQDPMCILVAEDHPLASREVILPEDLSGWTLTMPQTEEESTVAMIIQKLFSERYPQTHIEISNLEPSDYLRVQSGDELLLFGINFAKYIPHVRAIPFSDAFPKPKFGLITKANPSNIVRSFIRTIQASL